MAFAVASKGSPLATGLLNNLRRLVAPSSSSLLGPASVAATRRLYSTGGAPVPFHRVYNYEAVAMGAWLVSYMHHQCLAAQFYHPIVYTRTTMFFTPAAHWWWVSKQDEDAVEVKVAMPGLPEERVKVSTNKNALFVLVKGEGVKDPAPYSFHIELSADAFDLDKSKAEMKDGVLKITVPRVKGTEIKIE